MSVENTADETKTSHQSGDERGIVSTDFETAGSEDAWSMIAEPDTDDYQDLHRAEVENTQPGFEGEIADGSLDVEVSSSDEVLGIHPILELDENDHERYDVDVGAAQPDVTQDLPGMGNWLSDAAPHINSVLNIE